MACDSPTPSGPDPEVEFSFADLEVGQEWRYAYWEKRHVGERVFTGDTISVSVIAKEAGVVTFHERIINVDSIAPRDSATFRFQVEDSLLRQVGINRSRVFGFAVNHNGVLTLADIDSNQVTINIDTSLFLIREQTGQNIFVGHSNLVELFSDSYEDVIVYYDETPTYSDGFGHLAIFSRDYGVVTTIYFGGFSPIEAFGYHLVGRCEGSQLSTDAQLDEPFWLKFGESKFLQSEQLEIGFDEILEDSRCPEDVVCVWAGEAKIELWLLKPAQDTTFLSFTIPGFVIAESERHVSTDTLDYRIMVQQLDPYPNTNRQSRLSDYEALLVISNSTLINPFHPEFKHVSIFNIENYKIDKRLVMK